jgi:TRAP-type transport system periplasmic protein
MKDNVWWIRVCWALALSGLTGHLSAKELVMAEIHPPGHIIVKAEELFAARLAELTKGEVTVQLKHSAQLGNENQYWENVRKGSVDIVRINLGGMVKDIQSARLLSLPYLFRSRDHMWRVLNGDFGKRIKAEVEKTGAVVLTYYDSGARSFYTTKKPIQKRSDFNGLRIRVQDSPIYKDLITELGGTPVVVSYEKVNDAFRNGEIDGAENNLPSYVSSGHYKHARYYSMDEHSSVPEILLMSKKAWDGLTSAQQTAAIAAADESFVVMKKLWAESEAQALAQAKKEGVTILEKHQVYVSGIETYATRLYSKYITSADDLGVVLGILSSQ